jgi:hypothetical protein
MSKIQTSVPDGQKPRVIEVNDPLYPEAIRVYWNWLLGTQKDLDDHVRTVNGKKIFLTHCHYGYTYVFGIHDETGRKNLHRLTPESTPIRKFSNESVSNFDLVLIPVLDTLIYKQAKGTSGQPLSIDEMNAILAYENDHVTGTDMSVTIQKTEQGKSWGPLLPIVPNLFDYRLSSPADPSLTFKLDVPEKSVLADKMENPITVNSSLDARAEGYYLLVEKPSQPGTYRIFSRGHGLRNYHSIIEINITI